jgi:hypothetical protein
VISTAILWLSLSYQIFDPCGSVVAEWRQQLAMIKKPVYKIPRGEVATDIAPPVKKD